MNRQSSPETAVLRLGTRGSPLAMIQARLVRERLAAANPALPEVEIVPIRTTGDAVTDRPLAEIGGKGLFCKEIEQALLDGRIDLAAHSMKDVETWLPEGLAIACLLPREDPRDALIARPRGGAPPRRIADLPEGAVVGTASLRRRAQLLAQRPDLEIVNLRGNVETRLRKLAAGEADAALLALAGLNRLGLAQKATAVLAPEEMLPAVGQGAIGVEARADDEAVGRLLAPLTDRETEICVGAERALLEGLGGSCRTPIGVLAEIEPGGALRLRALLAAPEGDVVLRAERRGPPGDGAAMARDAAAELRAAAGPDLAARLGLAWE